MTAPVVERPRRRPRLGARLNADGVYELPPEAIEAAAERVIRHREACRARYTATRAALRVAKPQIFKQRWKTTINTRLDGDRSGDGDPLPET